MTAAARTVQILTQAVVVVLAGFVVVSVAASAGRLVTWGRPVYDFRIGLMTFGAVKIIPVVERLVRESCVVVICGPPAIRYVAQVAVLSSVEVIGILARCKYAVVAR